MKRILENQDPPRKRNSPVKKKNSGGIKKLLFIFFSSSLLIALILVFTGAGYLYFKYSDDLPDVKSLKDYQPSTITRLYSDSDDLIAEFYIEKRIIVPIEKMPTQLKQATLAVEDSNFYNHFGIDLKAILRAFITNLQAGHVVEGGSTITQQLSKTMFLSRARNMERKIKEAILAIRMELIFTKDEILELYLNNVYYGHGSYGVEAAARTYFGKSVHQLNTEECAMIAALPKAPNHYSPYKNLVKATKRKNHVLNRMAHLKFITNNEKNIAKKKEFRLKGLTEALNKAPYFVEHIRQFMINKFGSKKLYHKGLNVYTTLNLDNQIVAQQAVKEGLRKADKRYGYRGPIGQIDLDSLDKISFEEILNIDEDDSKNPGHGEIVKALVTSVEPHLAHVQSESITGTIALEKMNWARKPNPKIDGRWAKIKRASQALKPGDIIWVRLIDQTSDGSWTLSLEQDPIVQSGLLSIDPHNGHIKAMVGGFDFTKSQFNRAVQAIRQPGSAFKPIIYAAALENGYTPASIIMDSPVIFREKEESFDKWKPVNFEKKFFGPTSMRTALTHSRNVVTIKLLQSTGVKKAIELARKLGIRNQLAGNLSIALGSSGLTLYEMVAAYSVFANKGIKTEPNAIRYIKDREGEVIYQPETRQAPVISEGLAYLITSMMQSVVEEGTATMAKVLSRPTAGKTGTTNDYVDAWFIGYTQELVTGVWVGKDIDNPLGVNETGSRAAIPIWLQFMQEVLRDKPVMDFPVPNDVNFIKIDTETGYQATFNTSDPKFEVFLNDALPKLKPEDYDSIGEKQF